MDNICKAKVYTALKNTKHIHANQFSFQDTNPELANQNAGLPTSTPKKTVLIQKIIINGGLDFI